MKQRNQTPRHNLDLEETFQSVEKLLYQQAHRMAAAYNLPYEECLSECYFAFVRAYNTRYDAARGVKFSTFLQMLIQWRFRTMAWRQKGDPTLEEINEETAGFAAPQRSEALDVIAELSEDAQEVASLLLESPAELLEELPTPKRLLGLVKDYLREHGWTEQRVKGTQVELQTALRLAWAN